MNKQIQDGVDEVRTFAANSVRYLAACEKPDATGMSFFIQNLRKSLKVVQLDLP